MFCHKDFLSLHAKRCPLKSEGNKAKGGDSYQDGLLMLETYIPSSDEMDQRVNDLIQGMRETKANIG
jgi:hypothetical protein